MTSKVHDAANEFAREAIKQGLLIKAGWIGYKMMVLPPDAPQVQIDECRLAFYAGCQHLWGTLTNILDPEADVTDDDVSKMDSINNEMLAFYAEIKAKMPQ